MTSTDLYLKFADNAGMEAAFAAAGWPAPVAAQPVVRAGAAMIDLVGEIRLPPVLGPDDTELAPAETQPGWHVNLRLRPGAALPAALAPWVLDPAPATPHRRFP
ncbi:MAG: hypothetical protein TEF_04265 [Rhizobiales bacterium NRL2]|jgi:hypothetical protein|nr:MAG: hypothetical protein TEF_04265 [Rhizobiales bacterium NRL2]